MNRVQQSSLLVAKLARVRKGLYNYRGFNIKRFHGGWAVRDEDDRPFHSCRRYLSDVVFMIDRGEIK